jgi:hypothetical protein
VARDCISLFLVVHNFTKVENFKTNLMFFSNFQESVFIMYTMCIVMELKKS